VLRHLCHAYAGASAPVIKDPRLCILMSGLSPWLESGALRVEMLLTLRDPFEVARSLEAAQNLPSRDGLRLWLHYVLSAERMSRGWPRLMLHFESLIHDPHQNLERCLALLAAEQNTAAFEPANSFIDPELQHQHRQAAPGSAQALEHGEVVALARRGCVVEFDFFGIETSKYWMGIADLPTDWMRLRCIRRLFDAGLGDQVVISHDICTKSRLQSFGGHGYGHLLRNVVPLMLERGFLQAEIDRLLIETPRRLLTIG
jgi:hypothetical protein